MPDLRKRALQRHRARAPRPVQPRAIELRYFQAIRLVLLSARELARARLLPLLPDLLERAGAMHHDAAQPPGKRVSRLIEAMRATIERAYPQDRLEKVAKRIAAAVSEHQKAQLFRQVKALVGVDLKTIADRKVGPQVRHFTAENVALIKTVPAQYFADVERSVLAGMRAGTRHEDLADQIQERFGVAESRAALIARDQVLKFNGSLNMVRQQELGVSRYTWRTARDQRVREEHREREGEVYAWADPPGDPEDPATGGHPGTAINCRCFADPLLDDLIEEEIPETSADITPTDDADPPVQTVEIEALEDVEYGGGGPFDKGRTASIREAYAGGTPERLPPITVAVGPDGYKVVTEGQHRLSVAREHPGARIKVKFVRGFSEEGEE